MSASLTLALPEHLDRLMGLVSAFHNEVGIKITDEGRRAGLAPLLDGIPHGCAYLIGPSRAPIGYAVITFGWSVKFGGLDAIIDELFIRPGVRGRGVASEALIALPRALASGGLRAIHMEVDRTNVAAVKLFHRAGFSQRETTLLMSRRL